MAKPKNPPVKAGTVDKVVDAEIARRERAQAALDLKVEGKSFREIGRMMDISDHTVAKLVKEAQLDARFQRGRGVVMHRLVPKALAVYDQRLEAGDLEAARDILFGAGVLQKNAKVTLTAGDPLEQFRRKYFGEEEAAIEGEVVRHESVE